MPLIRRLISWNALALLANCVFAAALLAAPSTQSIDESIQRAMKEFQVPGMAVSVVYDGAIYYSGGHGILEIDKKDPIDDQTLFQIASVSKAFTAAALAILVDDGKLAWDDPVIDYLPEFRMYDPWVTREFQILDLLTHRSGLPLGAGDLLLIPEAKSTREEIITAMRYLKPSSSFRSKYDYDNLLYIIAGEVVRKVADTSFEEFLEQRLLFPLGMHDCAVTLERTRPGAAKATPHVLVDGNLETTGSLASTLSAAAGGVNCSARSMTIWMSFILDNGQNAEGEQLISEAQIDKLLAPVTLLTPRGYLSEHAGTFLSAYALGWNVSTFYGQPMYSHGGGLWGMTTYIAILPDQGLAVFASNNQMSPAPLAVANNVLDQFLDGISPRSGQDWISIIADVLADRKENAANAVAEAEASRATDSQPSLPLDAYVGTYRDPWYGDIQITMGDDDQLWFQSARSAPLSGPLEHFQYDTFIARWIDRQLNADAYVSFTLDPEGGVERIRMKAVSPRTDFSFDFHDLDLLRLPAD
jgi:CubicO group peptidase (beta-lactamase class C family)